jgi:hypothetical protein
MPVAIVVIVGGIVGVLLLIAWLANRPADLKDQLSRERLAHAGTRGELTRYRSKHDVLENAFRDLNARYLSLVAGIAETATDEQLRALVNGPAAPAPLGNGLLAPTWEAGTGAGDDVGGELPPALVPAGATDRPGQ